jgi:hypothetical protein
VTRQATGELKSFGLIGRDVDQHDVGTKRGRYVPRAFVTLEVRYDREPLGLEEGLARAPKGRVRVDDQHTNLPSRRPPPVLLALHASTMPRSARARIGVAACRFAGQCDTCSPRSIRPRSAREAICSFANTLRRW